MAALFLISSYCEIITDKFGCKLQLLNLNKMKYLISFFLPCIALVIGYAIGFEASRRYYDVAFLQEANHFKYELLNAYDDAYAAQTTVLDSVLVHGSDFMTDSLVQDYYRKYDVVDSLYTTCL